jgi:glutathione S-transferase
MKLVYFNVKGLGEPARLILAAAGEEYEDFRYPFDVVDLATYKFNKEEFDNDKKTGKLKKSMGRLPFLEVDGKVICQSKAIERYLASKFGLMGSNNEDSAIIDSYCESIRDIKTHYFATKKLFDKPKLKSWFDETLPQKLEELESLLNENATITEENTPNLFEIKIYHFLVEFFDNKEAVQKAQQNCKLLQQIVSNIATNTKIAAWIEKRPKTLM